MTFLASIAGYVATSLLSALGGWLAKMLHTWALDRAQASADEAKNAAVRTALENAKTPEERDNAAKGAADSF